MDQSPPKTKICGALGEHVTVSENTSARAIAGLALLAALAVSRDEDACRLRQRPRASPPYARTPTLSARCAGSSGPGRARRLRGRGRTAHPRALRRSCAGDRAHRRITRVRDDTGDAGFHVVVFTGGAPAPPAADRLTWGANMRKVAGTDTVIVCRVTTIGDATQGPLQSSVL